MNKKGLIFSGALLALMSISSGQCALSVENPMITITNMTGKYIPLVRVKVTLAGDKGTAVKGSLHIPNFSASSWWFWPGYAKVNALDATRWAGAEKPDRKHGEIDDFSWTLNVSQLVKDGSREFITDVFNREKKKDEKLTSIYVTKIKVFNIIKDIETKEREETGRSKFVTKEAAKGTPESFGTTTSKFSIIPAKGKPEGFTKYQRGKHLPHAAYEEKYGKDGKPMTLIYEVVTAE